MAEGQAINNDSRIVELLEMLTNNQMNAQAEQVRQICGYVETLEKQILSMTEEIKSVRQKLVSMKEDTISKHVKDSLKKAADTLQKQCDSLKHEVTELKEKICNKAGKIVDAAKQKGQRALYKIMQVTGMRKKLDAIKYKVDRAIDKVEKLEKAVGECQGQQERSSQGNPLLPDCVVAEPQPEYGAELFEQYQREHGDGQTVRVAEKAVMKEVGKSR